ncbi:MAG: hypothetical protein HY791_11255 [Deltaproteobacteria bacterium]|nr:hypothetical protein [Deltaproteobacteria bacterium]
MAADTCVVIATWEGSDPAHLERLAESLRSVAPGREHSTCLVINGSDGRHARLSARFDLTLTRDNVGFNLGAWDAAWRQTSADRYLFLQDECTLRRKGWLLAFERAFEPGVGLVGEQLRRPWNKPWDELTSETNRDFERARTYRTLLREWGVAEGLTARHLTTVVQYTSREVLEAVGGYRAESTYPRAIAAEIAFSRSIEARGLSLVQVGRRRHTFVGHPQWPRDGLFDRVRRSLWR